MNGGFVTLSANHCPVQKLSSDDATSPTLIADENVQGNADAESRGQGHTLRRAQTLITLRRTHKHTHTHTHASLKETDTHKHTVHTRTDDTHTQKRRKTET